MADEKVWVRYRTREKRDWGERPGLRDRASVDTATSTVEDRHSLLTTAWSLISCSLLNPLFVDNSISCQRK